jgi:hypothetical protein
MALNTVALKQGLISLYNDCDENMTPEMFAEQMSLLIEAFVKTGSVSVQAGILVTVAPTSGTGATTGAGTGTIS